MSTALANFGSGGGGGGGGGSKGYGGRRGNAKKKTSEEKAKSRNNYVNRVNVKKAGAGGGGYHDPIELGTADPKKLIYEFDKENEMIQVSYNIGTEENPIKVPEYYIVPPGTGMYPHMAGHGGKFDEGEKAKEENEFSGYYFTMQVALGLDLPDELRETCPNVDKEVANATAFLDARNKRYVSESLNHPGVYTTFKEECKKAADDFRAEAEERGERCDDTQWKHVYQSHFAKGINHGSKYEVFINETTKEKSKYFCIKMKTKAFRDNTGVAVPEEVLKEIKEGKNVYNKPVAEFIKRAYENSLMLTRVKWTDKYDKPLVRSLFDQKFYDGSTIGTAIRMNCYNKGKNRGTTIFINEGTTYYETEKQTINVNLNNSRYVKARPRTPHEIALLKMFKNNVKLVDGMNAVLIDAALKTTKMKPEDISKALEALIDDKFVVNGKDKNMYKLANPELDIERLPVEELPVVVPVTVAALESGGIADTTASNGGGGGTDTKKTGSTVSKKHSLYEDEDDDFANIVEAEGSIGGGDTYEEPDLKPKAKPNANKKKKTG